MIASIECIEKQMNNTDSVILQIENEIFKIEQKFQELQKIQEFL